MNEDWLAEPVCWGFGSIYRVALMSGGSRRLWNQLLHGTPSFVLSSFFNSLSHSWLSAFVRFLPSSLYIPFPLPHSTPPLSRFVTDGDGKDLFRIRRNYTSGITKDRFRGRSAASELRFTHVYEDTAIIVP